MSDLSRHLTIILVAALALSRFGGGPSARAQEFPGVDELRRGFARPPDDAKIMMRWWWYGPAVTGPQLEREMRLMKAGGIGGFEVQPTYPLLPDAPSAGVRNTPFLSDEFIEALRFTSAKARELNLRMDLTLGSGWPFGGPQVPVTEAAGMLRVERIKVDAKTRRVPIPSITAGEKLLAVFLIRLNGEVMVEPLRELGDIKDGVVWLPPATPADDSPEVVFFIASRTGMQVKRPALGAEGYVLNHLDRAAAENYLRNVGDRLMEAFGAHPPRAIFCDSLEVYRQDWTDDLLIEFARRRGYDLRPHLPALMAEAGPQTKAVRYDWGRTLTELLDERFLATVHDWSRRRRTLFRVQGYGVPAAALSSNAHADLPEGEGSQWKILRASRWASSASHLYDRPVTSSETWTWLHSPVFRATPLDLKAEADVHFLQGINQLIGHGWPYTAEGVEYPGWRFYAAGVYNEKNPWWIVMPDLALYLQRLSYVLRQGRPANDVALYLPNADAYAHFKAGQTHLIETLRELVGPDLIPAVLTAGYNFDFFDDKALQEVGRVQEGALALGPNQYKVVILPGVENIPPATLRRLEEFVRRGGVLIATRRLPAVAPGLRATEAEQREVREISRRLFAGPSAPAHFVANENSLARTLGALLRPDVSLAPATPDIGFVHRRTSDADIYFVANTSNERRKTRATFRVAGRQAEVWNAVSGTISAADGGGTTSAGTESIALDLEPYGSRVFVFSRRLPPTSAVRRAPSTSASIDLSGDWRVTFGANQSPVVMRRLRSWTEDEATRYFSGVAVYEKQFDVPEEFLRKGAGVQLDFGEGKALTARPLANGMRAWLDAPVREAAVIYVNGQKAGSLWCPPYAIEVGRLLRPGANEIKIEVANLAINYMAGRSLPDYRLLNLRYGERFQPQDMAQVQTQPAGLLGSIYLRLGEGGQ